MLTVAVSPILFLVNSTIQYSEMRLTYGLARPSESCESCLWCGSVSASLFGGWSRVQYSTSTVFFHIYTVGMVTAGSINTGGACTLLQ